MLSLLRSSLFKKLRQKYPVGDVGTKNAKNRKEWIIKQIKDLPEGLKLLDAGAGEQWLRTYCNHLEYIAQDFAQYDGKGDGRALQMDTWDQTGLDIISDITDLPIDDNSFDAVTCFEVLEHVPDPVKAIDELDRIIRPGGTLLITAPFNSLTHFAPYHYCTGFNIYFYEYHLNRLGYTLDIAQESGNYFKMMAQELRRLSMVTNKYARTSTNSYLKLAIHILLHFLGEWSKVDSGSQELQCYEWMIKAKKDIK